MFQNQVQQQTTTIPEDSDVKVQSKNASQGVSSRLIRQAQDQLMSEGRKKLVNGAPFGDHKNFRYMVQSDEFMDPLEESTKSQNYSRQHQFQKQQSIDQSQMSFLQQSPNKVALIIKHISPVNKVSMKANSEEQINLVIAPQLLKNKSDVQKLLSQSSKMENRKVNQSMKVPPNENNQLWNKKEPNAFIKPEIAYLQKEWASALKDELKNNETTERETKVSFKKFFRSPGVPGQSTTKYPLNLSKERTFNKKMAYKSDATIDSTIRLLNLEESQILSMQNYARAKDPKKEGMTFNNGQYNNFHSQASDPLVINDQRASINSIINQSKASNHLYHSSIFDNQQTNQAAAGRRIQKKLSQNVSMLQGEKVYQDHKQEERITKGGYNRQIFVQSVQQLMDRVQTRQDKTIQSIFPGLVSQSLVAQERSRQTFHGLSQIRNDHQARIQHPSSSNFLQIMSYGNNLQSTSDLSGLNVRQSGVIKPTKKAVQSTTANLMQQSRHTRFKSQLPPVTESEMDQPIFRSPEFNQIIENQSETFQQNVDSIVDNNTFLVGFKNVQVKQNKNPNSLSMYQHDFEMKMAKIESQLQLHVTSMGDQILSTDKANQEELEQKKHSFDSQVNNTSSIKVLKNYSSARKSKGKAKPKKVVTSHEKTIAEMPFPLQVIAKAIDFMIMDTKDEVASTRHSFLDLLKRKDFITQLDDQSSATFLLQSHNTETNSLLQSQRSENKGGGEEDIVKMKSLFVSNLQAMQNQIGSTHSKEELTNIVSMLINTKLKEQSSIRKKKRNDGSEEEHHEVVKRVNPLDYHRQNMYQTLNTVAQDISISLEVGQLYKDAFNPKIAEELINDSKVKYFMRCRKEREIVLPLLERIKKKTLNLTGYTVSSSLARIFGESLTNQDTILNRLILDSNNLSDSDYANILIGVQRLLDVKTLIYNSNAFGAASAEALRPIINQRSMPYHLEELRIINCRVSSRAMTILLESLNERNFIRRLSLVNANLGNEQSIGQLNSFITSSRHLIELDISWNALRPSIVQPLLETLALNRQLQYLNISQNNLLPQDGLAAKLEGGTIKEEPEGAKETKLKIPKVVMLLTRFIKYNKNLLHMDLSYTSLNEQALTEIGSSLKRGRSILSLHLTGNTGITKNLMAFLFNRIRCIPIHGKDTLPLEESLNVSHGSPTKVKFDNAVRSSLEGHEPLTNFVKEGIEVTQILRSKRQSIFNTTGKSVHHNEDPASDDKVLVFQRFVGHKEDMPGSGQWQMLTQKGEQCWICDRHIYTLVFWSPAIGHSVQVDIDELERNRIISQIDMINHDYPLLKGRDMDNQAPPLMCGSFTDWKYKEMMTLDTFLRIYDKTENSVFLKQLKERGRCRGEVKNEKEMTEQELIKYQQLVRSHHMSRRVKWRKTLLKALKYKQRPFLVNHHLVPSNQPPANDLSDSYSSSSSDIESQGDTSEDVWILPTFIRAGKHSYFVKSGDTHYAHKLLAPLRDEDIPIQNKLSKFKVIERVFKKETSVFREWKEDTPQVLNKAMELDEQQWKASRFIKDPDEVEACWGIIKQNFLKLKDVFISMASKSNFPSVTLLDFTNFADQCKIFDKYVNLSTIDRLFIATNVEIIANDENPDKELCRFELFEILLRLANVKYRESGICPNFEKALEKILKENVFANYKIHSWQDFRDKELWTADVNDVLEANLEGLKKVYAYFFDPRKKWMTMNDALDLMIRLTPLTLTEKDAIFCYGMCKMTTVNEAEESSTKYKRLQFVELLELIGRIADVKFKGTDIDKTMSLAQKIEFVLDDFLTLVEVKRRDVKITVDEHSESDDEY